MSGEYLGSLRAVPIYHNRAQTFGNMKHWVSGMPASYLQEPEPRYPSLDAGFYQVEINFVGVLSGCEWLRVWVAYHTEYT